MFHINFYKCLQTSWITGKYLYNDLLFSSMNIILRNIAECSPFHNFIFPIISSTSPQKTDCKYEPSRDLCRRVQIKTNLGHVLEKPRPIRSFLFLNDDHRYVPRQNCIFWFLQKIQRIHRNSLEKRSRQTFTHLKSKQSEQLYYNGTYPCNSLRNVVGLSLSNLWVDFFEKIQSNFIF